MTLPEAPAMLPNTMSFNCSTISFGASFAVYSGSGRVGIAGSEIVLDSESNSAATIVS